MKTENQIVMNLPKEVIQAQIQAAVVQSLQDRGDELVRALVKSSLEEKSRNSYHAKTLFDELVGNMIREEAKVATKEWVDELRPEIRKAVRERLSVRTKEKRAVANELADKLIDALGESLSVKIGQQS